MTGNSTEVGKLIKRSRVEKEWTQEELAQKLGFKNKSSIARIEKGSAKISIKKLRLFARVLDISIDELKNAYRIDMDKHVVEKTNLEEIPTLTNPNITFPDILIQPNTLIENDYFTLQWDEDGSAHFVRSHIDKNIVTWAQIINQLSENSKKLLQERAQELIKLDAIEKQLNDKNTSQN